MESCVDPQDLLWELFSDFFFLGPKAESWGENLFCGLGFAAFEIIGERCRAVGRAGAGGARPSL